MSAYQPDKPANPNPDQPSGPPTPKPWEHLTHQTIHPVGPRHTDPEDLTLYAMQLITGEEAVAIAQHIEHCAECRRELAHIHGDLGAYAFTVEMHEAPATARPRLMRQVSREKRVTPISNPVIAAYGRSASILGPVEEEQEKPKSHVGRTILGWTGWALAAGLALAAAFLYRQREDLRGNMADQASRISHLAAEAAQSHQLLEALTDPQAVRVTLTAKPLPPKSGPLGGTTYNPDKGTLVFLATGLDPLQTYKTYELWLIPADNSAPVPAGTFHPDDRGNASLIMPDLPKGVPAKGFGVTIEDEGGSQTPTKPIIMAGF
jgi:Anti-sigma-K factor rskA